MVARASPPISSAPDRIPAESRNRNRIGTLGRRRSSRIPAQSSCSNGGRYKRHEGIRQRPPQDNSEEYENHRPPSANKNGGAFLPQRPHLYHPSKRTSGRTIYVQQRSTPMISTSPRTFQYHFDPFDQESGRHT